MTGWLLRRLGQMIIVILGVVTLAFLLSYVVPGDPARLVAGPNASPQAVASIARQLGLDQSVWSQYVSYLGRLAHGNLGTSFALENQSVGGEIWRALPYTVWLALVGLSAPPFWLGLMLLYFLGYKLSLFPLSGTGSPLIWYLILPSFTLGVGGAA